MSNGTGKIIQVMGPVVDVEFPPGALPEVNTALRTTNAEIDDRTDNLVIEVPHEGSEHLDESCLCLARATQSDRVRWRTSPGRKR